VSTPTRAALRGVVAVAGVGVFLAILSSVARGHPWGPPATARISADGQVVSVTWGAAADDVVVMRAALGLLPEETGSLRLGRADLPQAADPTGSEVLRRYVLDRIRVTQHGDACSPSVRPVEDLVTGGVEVRFVCPAPVKVVDVEISMLVDLHPEYRTFAYADDDTAAPSQAVYTTTTPVHTWSFGAAAGAPRDRARLRTVVAQLEARVAGVASGDLPPLVAAAAVLGALGVGAVHALAPGHGKTIVSGYLLGSHARRRDAVAIGGVVAAMHTGSVLALGAILHVAAAGPFLPARIVPLVTLGAGVLVLTVGGFLVARHARPQPHGHPRAPSGLPAGLSPFSRRGLVVIGLAGGLVPSPATFLVLATAIVAGRTLYGIVLVAAFGVGLAFTITVVGGLTVSGRDLAVRSPRLPAGLTGAVPLLASLAVVAGGVWLTVTASLRLL
jgi:nickel/cobalt transporter (NicO) family protein